jgi:preprotein translocase subunit SecB
VATKRITKSGTIRSSKPLVDKVEIFAIGLDHIGATLDRSGYAAAYDRSKPKLSRSIRSDYKIADYSDEHFDIAATLLLRVEAGGFEDPLVSIDVTLEGHFHPKGKVSREEAEAFASGEARLVFWPYFRQIVFDTTARMHIQPITLPLVVR